MSLFFKTSSENKEEDLSNYTKLNLEHLSSGTYLITIYDNFSRFTRRLIVQ